MFPLAVFAANASSPMAVLLSPLTLESRASSPIAAVVTAVDIMIESKVAMGIILDAGVVAE